MTARLTTTKSMCRQRLSTLTVDAGRRSATWSPAGSSPAARPHSDNSINSSGTSPMGDHGSSSVSRKYSGTIAPTNVRTTPVDLHTTIIGGPGIGASGSCSCHHGWPDERPTRMKSRLFSWPHSAISTSPGGYHCRTSGEVAAIAHASSNVITVDSFPAPDLRRKPTKLGSALRQTGSCPWCTFLGSVATLTACDCRTGDPKRGGAS